MESKPDYMKSKPKKKKGDKKIDKPTIDFDA